MRSLFHQFVALLLMATMLPPLAPAQAKPQSTLYRFKKDVEVVLINVVVRDKNGNIVRGLTRDDFQVLEDNQPQTLASFDFEQTDSTTLPPLEQSNNLIAVPQISGSKTAPGAESQQAPLELHGRRLVVLFFDLSAMEQEEIERAVTAADTFLDRQMTPADLVAVVSLGSSLNVDQDFTTDRGALRKAVDRLNPSSGQGFENGSTGDTEGTGDNSNGFTADDTEYNIFNTDRRLEALQSLADSLGRFEQKKSVIYFSSGMTKTGIENQAQLRSAVNHAIRANVALYTMDLRGLQAIVPGGEAQSASLRGTSPYSGASVQSAFDSNFDSQETISTLANDTGGKAFLDSNDFNAVFKKVQADTSAYYLLTYRSTNSARDGKYRHVSVKLKQAGYRLEYRQGYYAPADFQHAHKDDREQQLVEELASDLPTTDLDVYLAAAYFRLSDNRFYVPVSLVVRGSQIPFTRSSDKDKATLDIIGVVQDELKRPVGNVRDTVKLAVEGSQQVRRKNVQYQTGFYLPSGKFHFKFVLRENQNGSMGSFETDFTIPDFKKSQLKVSAVVLGNQIQPNSKKKTDNPLVRDGAELIPNVTHVFSPDQHLYFYYEVYDPARDKREPAAQDASAPARPQPVPKNAIRVLTNIQLFRGKLKAYESPLVEARQLTAPGRKAAVFQFEVPLDKLQPGLYTCQVNVIDDAAGSFSFPRLMLLVRGNDASKTNSVGE